MVAESRQEDGKLDTDIQYLGKNRDRKSKSSGIFSKSNKKKRKMTTAAQQRINGVIPFKYGEIAYCNNPDPDKEWKLHANASTKPITLVDEHLRPTNRSKSVGPCFISASLGRATASPSC